jgi:NADH:ubiquinone reductase (H+-translocating)
LNGWVLKFGSTHASPVDADGITIGEERIASKNVIWTAGVAPHPLVRSLGLPTDRSGRIVVQGNCSVEGHPEVFIIGDAASFTSEPGKLLPGVAQVALQQGRYVGRLIASKVAGRPISMPFRYFDKGNLAVIGRFYAVIDSFGVRSSGFWAFLLWAYIHLEFLASTLSRLRTASQWLWMIIANQRVGCLIIPPKKVSSLSETIN